MPPRRHRRPMLRRRHHRHRASLRPRHLAQPRRHLRGPRRRRPRSVRRTCRSASEVVQLPGLDRPVRRSNPFWGGAMPRGTWAQRGVERVSRGSRKSCFSATSPEKLSRSIAAELSLTHDARGHWVRGRDDQAWSVDMCSTFAAVGMRDRQGRAGLCGDASEDRTAADGTVAYRFVGRTEEGPPFPGDSL
jgi:hypothetical protein